MKSTTDPGMEGQGMGGQNFGDNNLTPAGNDPANPPQNAGEGNAYFRRTQPAEEHPENENFVARDDQQKIGEQSKENGQIKPGPQQDYRQGTADEDGNKTFDEN